MEQPTSVTRDEEATELATAMLEQEETMRTILQETIDSALQGNIREAGRTYCPASGNVKGPLNRFPRAIDLAGCPVNRGGTWHTHVTPTEIRNPVNSLPDMSNVVFGLIDVSVVAGSETADVIVASKDQEDAVSAFQNAIGEEVTGPRDVSDAIMNRRIRPSEARERARDALEPLVFQVETGFNDLSSRAQSIPPQNWAAPYGSGMDESFSGNMAAPSKFGTESFNSVARSSEGVIGGVDLKGQVISTAVGTIIGGIVSRVVFGE